MTTTPAEPGEELDHEGNIYPEDQIEEGDPSTAGETDEEDDV